MVDAWGPDGRDEDPLAKLERLVSARTDRMTGRPATSATPGAGSLRGAIDDIYGASQRPAPSTRVQPVAEPGVADTFDAIADLDLELERVLRDTTAGERGDEFAPLDLPPVEPAPVRATEPGRAFVPREPVELPPSLLALRAAPPAFASRPAAEPALPIAPQAADLAPGLDGEDPLPRFLRREDGDAVSAEADEFEAQFSADLNDAVSDALAAATAAMAATATQAPSANRPAAIEPFAVPAAPAYEVKPQPTEAAIDFGDDFERDLVDELLQIEPPAAAAEADPLIAPLLAGDDDERNEPHRPANDNGGRRRGMMVAAMLAGVAVVGGLASLTLGGPEAPTEVALIRADPLPSKVRPDEPGGRTVPNQTNAVYERVAKVETAQAKAVATPTLVDKTADVSAIREPIVTGATVAASLHRDPKGGARLEAVDVSPDDVYAPRAVRTIRVRPDGTLVSSAPVAVPTAEPTAVDQLRQVVDPVDSPVVAALEGEPAPGTPLPRFRPIDPASASADRAAGVEIASTVPVAPDAPAALAEPVASAAPVAPAEPGEAAFTPGEYVVQIASVPTADAAQRTYAQLSDRFGSIIGGRGVDYQVADIPGKGRFHRVRVPAASKADASSTCAALKSAGGSCFVTR